MEPRTARKRHEPCVPLDDKGYDADFILADLEAKEIAALILAKRNRKVQPVIDELTSYVTNSWNLADGMTAVLHGGTIQIVGFAYDNLGRRTGISRSNGVSSTYGYDGAGRLISLSHDVGGTAADVTYTYAYNPAGQITSKTTSNDAYLWTPSVGGTAYTLNGLNQVTAAGATSLTYDANGNLTHDGTRAYAFDASNRLTGSGTATISYDALGRLDNYVGTSGARYLYDGVEAAGFATSGSTINTRFIRGPGVDEILASYTSTGSTPAQYWLSDERGSLVDTVNGSTGVSTAINTYDEYGNPGSGNVGRLQYTGQMWLPSFGAYHHKARAYYPGLGRLKFFARHAACQVARRSHLARNGATAGTRQAGTADLPKPC
ncbi:hypothetical protein [Brevundimonas naejangsanensis]|uniref:hypothetical protein n=1 Tax=Brevundimonas naejangsanensis TaxID=588932 RepID=UPI00320B7002